MMFFATSVLRTVMFLLLFNVLTLVTNFPNPPFSLENYGGHSIGAAAAAVLSVQDSIS